VLVGDGWVERRQVMLEIFGLEWVTWGYIAATFGLLVLVEVVIIQYIRD